MFFSVRVPYVIGSGPIGWTGVNGGLPLTNNNRTYTLASSGSTFASAWRRYTADHTGKRQFEALITTNQANNWGLGLIKQTRWTGTEYPGNNFANAAWYAQWQGGSNLTTTGIILAGTTTTNASYAAPNGTVVGIAVDYGTLKGWVIINGVAVAGDPAAGTGNPITLPSADFDPIATLYTNAGTASWTANFNSADLVYPISGFSPFEE